MLKIEGTKEYGELVKVSTVNKHHIEEDCVWVCSKCDLIYELEDYVLAARDYTVVNCPNCKHTLGWMTPEEVIKKYRTHKISQGELFQGYVKKLY